MDDPTTIDSLIAAVAKTPAVDESVPVAIALKHGDVLGTSYVIEDELGRGGMGVVYRATDKTLGREVAIKVMRADRWPTAQQHEVRAVFEREARATAKLKHPSIVTAYHAGQDESGVLFLVLELLHGESLHQRLTRGPMGVDDAIATAEEIADAVVHAHGHGILHRDLKPQNVFLCEDHRVCLLDFGLAALKAAGHGDTQSRSGTPSSMAPEQWRGEPQDERTDVWAMGLLLYRMVTGAPPPDVHSDTDLAAWLAGASFAGVPAPIERVIRRAIAYAPAERFPSARAFLTGVRKARPRRTGAIPVAEARGPARRRLTYVVAGATAVAIAGGGVAWWLHARSNNPPAKLRPEQKAGRYDGEFGEVLLEVHGDRVRGAYQHDRGLIEGRMVGDKLVGVWCEEPSRAPPLDGGDVEFRFMFDAAKGRVLEDGRWRYGRTDAGWDERWDMYRSADTEDDPALRAVIDDTTLHCPNAP